MTHTTCRQTALTQFDSLCGPSRHARFLMGFAMGGMMMGGGLGPVGVEGGPQWRGDHTFSSAAAFYSLEHFIEPEVEKEHPSWTGHQVRQEAVRVWTKRLTQDRLFDTQERSRQPEMTKHWEVSETTPGVFELTTDYGDSRISLRELWEHTREYAQEIGVPEAYNHEEAKAQLAMQDALISGKATSFVGILSHPDAIRYAQIWDKTPAGTVVSKTIDLSLSVGRDLTMGEATTLVANLAKFHKSVGKDVQLTEANYPHLLISKGSAKMEDVKTIARAQIMVSENTNRQGATRGEVRQRTTVADAVDTVGAAATRAVYDSVSTVRDLGVFVRERFSRRLVAQPPTDPDNEKHLPIFLKLLQKKDDRIGGTLPQDKQPKVTKVVPERKGAIPIREKVLVFERGRTPVAPAGAEIGALLWGLHELSETSRNTSQKITKNQEPRAKRGKDKVKPGAKENLQSTLTQKERRKKARKKKELAPYQLEKKTSHRRRKKEQARWQKRRLRERLLKKKKPEKMVNWRAAASRLTMKERGLRADKREKKRKLKTSEKRVSREKLFRSPQRLRRIFVFLARQMREDLPFEKKRRRYKKERNERRKITLRPSEKQAYLRRRERKKQVAGFTFAFLWWWLEYRKLLNEPGRTPRPSGSNLHILYEGTPVKGKEATRSSEALVAKEPTQWLLLAIIWYLAQIREQGRSISNIKYQISNKNRKIKSNKKISKNPLSNKLPLHGVIFAFAS